MRSHEELIAYQKTFELAMEIFEVSKKFPKEEKYSLTDQIRRSSRSVCSNLAEASRKQKYPAYFVSKLTDCDSENAETGVWLNFSYSCSYITEAEYIVLKNKKKEVGKLIGNMLNNPGKFL